MAWMRLPILRSRELATRLRSLARLRPREVEEYLDTHTEEWESLAETDPHDAADILEQLGEGASGLLADLDSGGAAGVLDEMRPHLAAELIEELSAPALADIIEEMETEEAVDLLAEMGPEQRRQVLIELEPGVAREVEELLTYPPDTAGGLMTTEMASLPVGLTTGEAIERLRVMHDELSRMWYVYVVSDEGRLEGVVSFRDLVFSRPGVGLAEVMVSNPVAVRADADRDEVAEVAQRYHLMALPVVDDTYHLLGVVTNEALVEAVQEEAAESFASAVGAGGGETIVTPVRRSVRSRLPWILVDVVLSFLVALVVSRFENTIRATTVLAALMPLVARVGGDSGAQSLAVVIRSLAIDDIPTARVRQVIRREVKIGVTNGLAIAAFSGLITTLLEGPKIGFILFLAVWVNLALAGLAGSGIPLLMRRLGFDPALASNLFLTTITDLFGFGGFLAVATILL